MADDGPPLRIIHCFRSPVGGVFRHVRDLIEEHVKQGHKVGIVCDSSTGGAHEERLFRADRPDAGARVDPPADQAVDKPRRPVGAR